MFDNFELHSKKHDDIEPDIVPIIDLLVCIIFFLLMTVSFISLVKHGIPPSGVSIITDPVVPPPINPKLYVTKSGSEFNLVLTWSGLKPGARLKKVRYAPPQTYPATLQESSGEMMKNFLANPAYSTEQTLQVGFGRDLSYQAVVAVMDGVVKHTPDVVLLSYAEAEAISRSYVKNGDN